MAGVREFVYPDCVRSLLSCALLLALSGPSLAMNWEGHDDDWHKDLPVAQAFRDAVNAAPLERPLPPCDRPLANVYEQVPISGKNCLPVRERPSPERRE